MNFPLRRYCSIRVRKLSSAAASSFALPLVRNASSQKMSQPSWRKPSTYCRYTQKWPPPSGKAATLYGAMTTVGTVHLLRCHLCPHGQGGLQLFEPPIHFGQLFETPVGLIQHQRNRRPDHPVGEARQLVRLEQQIQLAIAGQMPAGAGDGLPV